MKPSAEHLRNDIAKRVIESRGFAVTGRSLHTFHAKKGTASYAIQVYIRRISAGESPMKVIKKKELERTRQNADANEIPIYTLVAWLEEHQGTHLFMLHPDRIPKVFKPPVEHGYNVIFKNLPESSIGKEGYYQFFPDTATDEACDTSEDIRAIVKDRSITDTEKDQLIKARVGQGQFREDLIRIWNKKCSVTGCGELRMLKASHIKPWRSSDNKERLDPYNGFLIIPNLDTAFDHYLITFKSDGLIVMSKHLSKEDRTKLGISPNMRVKLRDPHQKYLTYHRETFQRTERAYCNL